MTSTESPQAFATMGEWIVAAGTTNELRARFPRAEPYDFEEGTIVPGFNDAHQHPTMMAADLLHVDLSPELISNPADLRQALTARTQQVGPGAWVIGSRYDHTKSTPGGTIDRHFLDRITAEHPVMVRHIAGHWCVVNSAGLRAAGYDEGSADPPGGQLGRSADGRLDGVLYERAADPLSQDSHTGTPVIPVDSLVDRRRALREYFRRMHAAGITSVGDALVNPDGVELLQSALAHGELSCRVNMLIYHQNLGSMRRLGLTSGLGGTRLRIGGVKAFVDGAIAGGTCLLDDPYEGTHDDHGIQALSTPDLRDMVRTVHDSGGTACVHANGDRAIRLVLDALEAAQRSNPRPEARHRIEHCTVIDQEILARMKALGVVAVPFGSYVAFHGEKLPGYYGKRVERMFAHRSLLDAGIPVAGSSDFPCGPYEPLLAMRSCVTRESAEGVPLGPDQRITAREALALYTTGSAYAAGEETIKGRLEPGMLADFTVLAEDPLEVAPDRLASIGVAETWVGAQRVWQA